MDDRDKVPHRGYNMFVRLDISSGMSFVAMIIGTIIFLIQVSSPAIKSYLQSSVRPTSATRISVVA